MLELLISLMALCISVGTLIYVAGYKVGQLSVKIDLLWRVYVEEALIEAMRHGYIMFSSSIKLTSRGEALLSPALKAEIDNLVKRQRDLPKQSEDKIAFKLMEEYYSMLRKVSEENNVPLRAVLATAAVYVKVLSTKGPSEV